ncbi:MAG: hypothetical protein ACR2QW_17130 [bacterium]
MSRNKKIESRRQIVNVNKDASDKTRRKALRNLLSGTGIVAGAQLAGGTWVKPVVESVLLPAHAQTSGIVLAGIAATGGITSILDVVVQPTYAQAAQVPGGCVFLYFFGTRISVDHFSNSGGVDSKSGVLDGANFNFADIHGIYNIMGTVDDPVSPTSATGTVSGGGVTASFTATTNTNACGRSGPPPRQEEA